MQSSPWSGAFLAVVLSMTSESEARAQDTTYVCKYSGRTRTFTESPDRILVRFAETTAAARRAEITRDLQCEVSSDNTKNLGFYLVPAARDMRAVLSALKGSPEVFEASPVLVDHEGFPYFPVPGELTVMFRGDLSKPRAEEVIHRFGSEIVTEQRTPGYYTITVPQGMTLFQAIRAMNEEVDVRFSEGSFVRGPSGGPYSVAPECPTFPNDTLFCDQWALDNRGQSGGSPGADISAEEAWAVTTGDPDTVIAVIDPQPFSETHPDAPNYYPQNGEDWLFNDPSPGTSPFGSAGHGFRVASTAAARGNNDEGIAGVCMDCRVIPIRYEDGPLQPGQVIADAINYVADFQLAHPELTIIINGSIGSPNTAAVEAACQYAHDSDVPLVFSTGNHNGLIGYPARYSTTIAVGATNACDERWSTGPGGACPNPFPTLGSSFGPELDVVAPGADVLTTMGQNGYGNETGTSFAAPHVAGMIGLLLSFRPHLSYQEVRSILHVASDDGVGLPNEDTPGFDPYMGWGRINAHRALIEGTPCDPDPSIICVPCESPNLATAIADARAGDTVLLADGVYRGPSNRRLIVDKDITIKSETGPGNCIIDAQHADQVFLFVGRNIHPRLEGLTIRRGLASRSQGTPRNDGAGIHCSLEGSSLLKVENCIVEDCVAASNGGGMWSQDAKIDLERCVFRLNTASGSGGGLHVVQSSTSATTGIFDSTFVDNTSRLNGGGIYASTGRAGLRMAIWNSTIADNSSNAGDLPGIQGGGIYARNDGVSDFISIQNCILWANTAGSQPSGHQLQVAGAMQGNVQVGYCDVQGGLAGVTGSPAWNPGNISQDPIFVAVGDYHIQGLSPCVDAGNPAYVPIPGELDIDGQNRVNGGRIDMGSDETSSGK